MGEAGTMKEKKRWKEEQDFTVLLRSAAITPIHSLSSSPHTLLHAPPRPRPDFRPCFGFLSISCSTAAWVVDAVSRKTGLVFWEMRKTVLRELSHRESYLPSPLLTSARSVCMHKTHVLRRSSENPTFLI